MKVTKTTKTVYNLELTEEEATELLQFSNHMTNPHARIMLPLPHSHILTRVGDHLYGQGVRP